MGGHPVVGVCSS